MENRVEVTILNQPFVFIGKDSERIKRLAKLVDERIKHVINDYGIINTLNAVIMAMMELTDEYLEVREQAERFEGRALKILKKVEELEVPCDVRDKW